MRTKIAKRLALIAMIPATMLGLVAVATPANAAVVSETKLQGDIVYLTNKQRVANGCKKALHLDARLTKAARVHSAYMAKTGAFSHTGSGGSTFVARQKAAGYKQPAGENIAYGYRTGAAVVTAWMKSPEHRANILNCKATTIGAGTVYAKSGTPYFTQEFGY
ncbi:CAP domain-containing protein [Actinoplanes sp. KI2]|uniref:CAP domain-containing protein n=1 Tax=Actinoplanes sp. KI2 TaxID=2983315 RepID=UPI0021D59420|nr:CAP domain-containing protein [Actinoplanes sp. KI2]MCU7723686.1 CAP domain-containing protein [Actinoplanes sp. KI2]